MIVPKSPPNSLSIASTFSVGLALFLCSAALRPSQSQTSMAAQPSTPPSAPAPARSAIEPRLDVDRDPVLSPDAADHAPGPGAAAPNLANEIQKGQNGTYVLHADVDEVLLNCTVIDSKGQTVPGLNRGNFRVWEDGVPQTVNSVLHEDVPVSMGIVVDNSGSMRDKRAQVNQAAYSLLEKSNAEDTAFIVNFSDRAFLDQGFTSDLVALHRGLSRSDPRGTTALYDAAAASADELVKHGKHRKQVLLIITDGADNASRLDLSQAIRRVQSLAGPVVYTIGLLFDVDQDEADRARNALERLSQETGGIAYFPHTLADVNAIAGEVARDIHNQYTVDYHSSKPISLGGYRTVRVEVSGPNHERLTVRTKHGYYATSTPRLQSSQDAVR